MPRECSPDIRRLLRHRQQACLCDALMLDCWCEIALACDEPGLAETLAARAEDQRQLVLVFGSALP